MSAVSAVPGAPGVHGYPEWFRPLADLTHTLPPGAFARWAVRRPAPGTVTPRAEDGAGPGSVAAGAAGVRHSAVLMLFGDDPARVLLTRRAASLRSHAGQVAFPGGGIEPDDAGPEAAAVREAVEETGLDPAGVRVVGTLPTVHLWVSSWQVTPVLAWWQRPSAVGVVDPAEVEAVAEVPLEELLDPANRFSVAHPTGASGPAFRAGGLFVWGFTAMLLSELLALGGLERPWDRARTEAMP